MFVSIYDTSKTFTKEDLGGKGYSLWHMAQLGVNVPPAIIIPPEVCVEYLSKPKTVMTRVKKELKVATKFFMGRLGYMPLLSVRSGAKDSMPGMLDTILNVGLHSSNLAYWSQKLGESCVTDSYERLAQMYSSVVLGKKSRAPELEVSLPEDQILNSIEAVFRSWNNDRAKTYRELNNLPHHGGTAVILQSMVFGNLNDQSCTGVLFTRNPDNGDDGIVGEYLVNAQGEDVVSGVKTPLNLSTITDWNADVGELLKSVVEKLEKVDKDVLDVEFTVQSGELFILQKRAAKRTPRAAVKIACDLYKEGVVNLEEMISRVSSKQFDLYVGTAIAPSFTTPPYAVGIPACSGVVCGVVVHTTKNAINCKEPCVLVTEETTPDDIAGMNAAVGILTMTGGSTSHAAVVARSMNKPTVVGLSKHLSIFKEGSKISINGSTGEVWLGEVPIISGANSEYYEFFLSKLKEMYSLVPVCRYGDDVFVKSEKLIIEASSLYGVSENVVSAFLTDVSKYAEELVLFFNKDTQVSNFNQVLGTVDDEETRSKVFSIFKTLNTLCKKSLIVSAGDLPPSTELGDNDKIFCDDPIDFLTNHKKSQIVYLSQSNKVAFEYLFSLMGRAGEPLPDVVGGGNPSQRWETVDSMISNLLN